MGGISRETAKACLIALLNGTAAIAAERNKALTQQQLKDGADDIGKIIDSIDGIFPRFKVGQEVWIVTKGAPCAARVVRVTQGSENLYCRIKISGVEGLCTEIERGIFATKEAAEAEAARRNKEGK